MDTNVKVAALDAAIKSRKAGDIVAAFKAVHHMTAKANLKAWQFNAIVEAFAAIRENAPAWAIARTDANAMRPVEAQEMESIPAANPAVAQPVKEASVFDLVTEGVITYRREAGKASPALALRAVASGLRKKHEGFAILGEAVYAIARKEGDTAAILRTAWEDLTSSAKNVSDAYGLTLIALARNGSKAAFNHARPMDLHPIELQTGDAGTHTAMNSLEQLTETLKGEKALVEALARTGRARRTARSVHELWMSFPEWLRDAIKERAFSTKFCTAEQKARVNGRAVKGRAYAAISALESGVINGKAIRGASIVIRELVKLVIFWAQRAESWAMINEPRKPSEDTFNDESYAGEEDKVYESPLTTYEVTGRTNGDRWLRTCEIFQSVTEDFEHAAELGEQALDQLADAMETQGYEVIYAFIPRDSVKETATGLKVKVTEFDQITDKDEAAMALMERAAERRITGIAQSVGTWVDDREEVTAQEVLEAEFTADEIAALDALMAGGAA